MMKRIFGKPIFSDTDKWGRQLCKWDADCGKSNKTCILGTCRNPKSNAPRKCRKSSECDMNATCSKNGTCVCDTGYEWSPGFDICRTIDKQ